MMMVADMIRRDRTGQRAAYFRFSNYCLALACEMHDRLVLGTALSGLSRRQLRDIGLTHDDVAAACSGPLPRNSATELRRTAELRACNW